MWGLVIGLGLVTWLVTMIVVESEIVRPLREWIGMKADLWSTVWADGEPVWLNSHGFGEDFVPGRYTDPDHKRFDRTREVAWRKARYLFGCHLCSGCWIAAAVVAVQPLHVYRAGFVGFLFDAALVKAVAHLTLVVQKAGEGLSR